jgi:hypothetical protein
VSEAADNPAAAILSEARGLLLRGWCRGALARDASGNIVPAWSDEACAWSLLGALLLSWHRQSGESVEVDVVAHSSDPQALAEATQALIDVTGSPSIERWNDDPQRTRVDVVETAERAAALLAA